MQLISLPALLQTLQQLPVAGLLLGPGEIVVQTVQVLGAFLQEVLNQFVHGSGLTLSSTFNGMQLLHDVQPQIMRQVTSVVTNVVVFAPSSPH